MRDLEIRAMGNVIGAEQSGHVAAIGLHLYTQLLSQSVEELKRRIQQSPNGEAHGTVPEVRNGNGVQSLPHSIASPASNGDRNGHSPKLTEYPTLTGNHRAWSVPTSGSASTTTSLSNTLRTSPKAFSFHQRLSWANTEQEIAELRDELRDRYGPIPVSVEGLLETARIRLLAEQADCASVRASGERARIIMNTPAGGAKTQLQHLLGPPSPASATPRSVIQADKGMDEHEFVEEIAAVLETIRNFKQRVMALLNACMALLNACMALLNA